MDLGSLDSRRQGLRFTGRYWNRNSVHWDTYVLFLIMTPGELRRHWGSGFCVLRWCVRTNARTFHFLIGSIAALDRGQPS